MKKTLIIALFILVTTSVYYFSISNSIYATNGSITVCWDPLCGVPNTTEIVELVRVSTGNIVGSCQLEPSENCCIIQGDFPSGKYYLQWHQPDSDNLCSSSEFYYTNGTNVEFDIICNCPKEAPKKSKINN